MLSRAFASFTAISSRRSYGSIIIASAFLVLMISSGITYSTAVVFRFIETELGIGRGQSAFVFASSQFVTFIVGPFAGALEERVGPRIVVTGGIALLCAGSLGAARRTSYPALLLWYCVAIGIGNGAIYVPSLGVIQKWFHRRRGLATGLSTTGVSVGTLVFPLATQAIATSGGWRMVYVVCRHLCFDRSRRGAGAGGGAGERAPMLIGETVRMSDAVQRPKGSP